MAPSASGRMALRARGPKALTWWGAAGLRARALDLPAALVHAPAVPAVPVALQWGEVALCITLWHILVAAGAAAVVLQQALPPALTHGWGTLRGLWHGNGDRHPPAHVQGLHWSLAGRSGDEAGMLWGGQLYSTHLGSRSAAVCCPVLSWCQRSPAPRCPRTSSARCCRGTARAGSCPAHHTVARAHCPRVRGPVALPVGTAARAHMVSAAGRNLWAEKHLRHTGGQGAAWSWAPGAALTLWARGP